MFVDGRDDTLGIVPGINADRTLRFLAADDASVLLKSSDSDFFDDHRKPVRNQSLVVSDWSIQEAPLTTDHEQE